VITVRGPARTREDVWLTTTERKVVRSLDVALASVTDRLTPSQLSAAAENVNDAPAQLPITVDDLTTVVTAWRVQVDAVLAPQVAEVYAEAASVVRDQVAARVEPDVVVPEVPPSLAEAYLATATNRLARVGDTVWAEVRDEFTAGVLAGESTAQLAARITGVHGVVAERATVIARTEVLSAARGGAYDQVRSTGMTGTHEWLATSDARTRESHREADGQVRPVDRPFQVGSTYLRFPGDPLGAADEVIQCRCDQLFELDEGTVGGELSTNLKLTAAGTADAPQSGMIALIPTEADVRRLAEVATEQASELHLTLLFLGDVTSYDAATRAALVRIVADTVTGVDVAYANVFGAAVWNPGDADTVLVLNVGGDELTEVQDVVSECVAESCGDLLPAQHVPWVPHITLAYGTDAPSRLTAALGLTGPVTFDRVRVAFGGETTDISLYRSPVVAASGTAEVKTLSPEVHINRVDGSTMMTDPGVVAPTDTELTESLAQSPAPSGGGVAPDDVSENMGGKPNPGTKKDKRLKENDYAVAVPTVEKNIADLAGTAWQGVLAVEGTETGDGRVFAEGSLVWDMPPLPLRWTPRDDGAHQGAVLVARIDNVWRDSENPAVIRGEGVFDDQGMNGAEALRLVRGEFLKGVSVDVDSVKDADVELVFPEPADGDAEAGEDAEFLELFQTPEKVVFHAGRIRAATLVDIPAFVEAQIWLTDGTMKMQASSPPPTAGFAELETLFAHGCGGDINITACAVGVKALLTDAKLPVSLARRRAVYDHLSAHLQDAGLTPLPFDTVNFSDELVALVAGLVPQDTTAPPAEWFTPPELDEPTPLTVGDDGRIVGHGALWNSCHTGFGNTCVSPPREGLHTYFRQGELVTAEGRHIAVGHITLGTGHAPTYGTDVRQALEHYDNTGTVVADVTSGEDQFGIWVAGALRPGLAPARVRELRAAKLSGDWRRIGGQLRLVAFLAVNVPGFPVPRLRAEVNEGRQLSLVASGIMRGNELEERERSAEREALNNIRHHLQQRLGLTPAERAQALRQRVLGGA
jgi:2'-5' RNA ligase